MISLITWLWNIRHRRLIEETKVLIRLQLFLEQEIGLKGLSLKALKAVLRVLKNDEKM